MPKIDFSISPPVLNAAGSLGFTPNTRGPVDLGRLGAFITHPISRRPRSPAQGTNFLAYAGGFLLHTGYPNPGLTGALRNYAARWARSPIPVVIHLLAPDGEAGEASGIRQMVMRLEGLEGIAALEIGLGPETEVRAADALVREAFGELPLILRLPLETAASLADGLLTTGAAAMLAAVSLAPPRGSLPDAAGQLTSGRLYGPSIFPLALQAVRAIVGMGLPVIGSGGVYHQQDLETMLEAGAMAVQVDAWLWRGDF